MALATKADVELRLGRTLSAEEAGAADARVNALLEDASAVVIGYCRQDFEPAPYPEAVVGVTAKMVARVYERSASSAGAYAEQQTAGPFGVRFSSAASTGDVWMTAADRLALRPVRLGGGMQTVPLVGERHHPPVVTES